MEVVGHVTPSWLHQLVKPHLLLLKSPQVLQYCFGDCAQHTARFIIFAQHAQLCVFLIISFVFPILLVVGTCKIAQTVSDSIQHLLKCCFWAFWLSIVPFQHFLYLPALVQSLSLHLQLTFLLQRFLYPYNPQSIAHFLRCLKSAFLIF